MSPSPPTTIVLHTWPGCWDLPSFDPSCLAAILHLQLVIPGGFTIVECHNPDLSPFGQLPYISHENQTVSTLPSIIKYVSKLKVPKVDGSRRLDIDAGLASTERVQSFAWLAHISANMGDLVAHMLYSLEDNWTKLTKPTMAAMQPIPQRYYLPDRVREAYRPRLEAVGLWSQPGVEQQEKKPFEKPTSKPEPDSIKETYLRVFERQKVEEKACSVFDVYTRLLSDKTFFFQEQCTSLDVLLAAHILLLTKPPFPDPIIRTILTERYSSLVNHSERVLSLAMPSGTHLLKMSTPSSLAPLFSLPRHSGETHGTSEEETERKRYTKMRWTWFALAGASVAYYVLSLSMLARARALREAAASDDDAIDSDDAEEEEAEEGEIDDDDDILSE